MTRAQRILISCVLVTLIIVLFYNFSIKSKRQRIYELTQEHVRIAEILRSSQTYMDRYKTVRAAHDSISEVWEKVAELLPEEEEMPELLTAISDAGKRSGAEFILFKPLSPVPRDFFQENPIQIKVKCGYHELGRFLSKVAGLMRLVNVSTFKLVGLQEPKVGLEAEFVATAYTTQKTVHVTTKK